MKKNVLEWLEENKDNENIVYQDENESISFSKVYDMARRIGSSLKDVRGNSPIAIISGRKISTIYSYLGIVYSGHAYAPIDGSLPEERIKTIIDLLKPSAVVADRQYSDLVESLSNNVYFIDELITGDINESFLKQTREEMVMTDPLYVIFTSGSTGRPKGVITSHQSLMCYINSYIRVMDINCNDVLGNQSPLDYIAAIRDIYIPLFTGCKSVIIPKTYFMQPNELFNYMNQKHITAIGWSTSAFTVAVSLGAFEEVMLNTLKKICFSGSVMPVSTLKIWRDNIPDAKFVNQYGPTEATASCTYYVIDDDFKYDRPIPIGKPYDNYKVFLLNEDLSPTLVGELGEICVSGPILALGYYNDPERTEKSFIINPNIVGFPEKMYKTGDYGRINSDGILEFHGRMDRQIKYMGHRVELDEIECASDRIDGVDECVALFNEAKEIIYLFYSGETDKKTIVLELRKILPEFMIPRKIKKLEALPKLANGKINMNVLKESF